MFNIKGIKTFAMSAKDLAKAEEFYTKVLDFLLDAVCAPGL